MNDVFAALIEFLLFQEKYSETLYDGNSYVFIGLTFLVIPFVFQFVYYKLIDPVYSKKWQTVILMPILIYILVYVVVFVQSGTALIVAVEEKAKGVSEFRIYLSLISGMYTIIVYFIFAIFMRFLSNNNRYNPF